MSGKQRSLLQNLIPQKREVSKIAHSASAKRKSFTKTHDALPLGDLIEIQTESYRWFFEKGLRELFGELGTISDFTGKSLDLTFGD